MTSAEELPGFLCKWQLISSDFITHEAHLCNVLGYKIARIILLLRIYGIEDSIKNVHTKIPGTRRADQGWKIAQTKFFRCPRQRKTEFLPPRVDWDFKSPGNGLPRSLSCMKIDILRVACAIINAHGFRNG